MSKNNNSASRFFLHFFAVPTQLWREMPKFWVDLRTGTARRYILLSLSLWLGRGPLSSVPTKLPHLHVTGWLGVREKKLQRKRNPFFSDVFIRFASGYLAFRISEALSGAQRSTIGEKIWLSMHPRNFGSDKIVRTYVHPFMLGCEMTNQLARSPRLILLVSKFGIGHPCYGQLTAVKKGIRWPVSHDCIVSSGI